MSESSTLARPYAEALFQIARDTGALEPWSTALDALAIAASDAELRRLVGDPRVGTGQLVSLLAAVVPEPAVAGLESFLTLVVENRRVHNLPDVAKQFRALRNAHEGAADARVETAFALDDSALAELRSVFERRFGLRLNIEVAVDPSLIGGVRVTVGDKVLDASVRARLEGMQSALLNPN
jgi:F-type H+-transporting ATPase subunit delta